MIAKLAGHPVRILNIYHGVDREIALIEVLDGSDILEFGRTGHRSGLIPMQYLTDIEPEGPQIAEQDPEPGAKP